MISTLEIEDKLYQELNVTAVTTIITGKVYKKKRPINSQVEDITINCLPTNNLQIQTAIANVNIHVPNIIGNANGAQESIANHARLKVLATLVISLLKDVYRGDFWFDVESQNVFPEETEHYINIRVKIFSTNI